MPKQKLLPQGTRRVPCRNCSSSWQICLAKRRDHRRLLRFPDSTRTGIRLQAHHATAGVALPIINNSVWLERKAIRSKAYASRLAPAGGSVRACKAEAFWQASHTLAKPLSPRWSPGCRSQVPHQRLAATSEYRYIWWALIKRHIGYCVGTGKVIFQEPVGRVAPSDSEGVSPPRTRRVGETNELIGTKDNLKRGGLDMVFGTQPPKYLGKIMENKISLTVNGQQHSLTVIPMNSGGCPAQTLKLTGTRSLRRSRMRCLYRAVDGEPTMSCVYLPRVRMARISDIEGLAKSEDGKLVLHPFRMLLFSTVLSSADSVSRPDHDLLRAHQAQPDPRPTTSARTERHALPLRGLSTIENAILMRACLAHGRTIHPPHIPIRSMPKE